MGFLQDQRWAVQPGCRFSIPFTDTTDTSKVTFGMWLIGSITIFRAALLIVVQLLGALAAAGLVDRLFSGGLNVSTELSTTTTIAQGFFIEMILTAQLVFAIFMLAAEKHAGTFIAPVGIGLALFICELTGMHFPHPERIPAHQSFRRFLDRRITESCPVIWPRCCRPQLSWISLAILGCPVGGSWTRSCAL
jgi:Major intrinsic protein